MKILIASSELHPYSKTGGLADMVGALAHYLAEEGAQVTVVTPLYRGLKARYPDLRKLKFEVDVPMGARRVQGEIWHLKPNRRLTVYFVDQPAYFDRAGLYMEEGKAYHDNVERFLFFSKVVVDLARYSSNRPDVVHAHDWQAGLVPLLIRHQHARDGWVQAPATVFTIHNLAYQGQFPVWDYALANLPWDYYSPQGVEFYGGANCLKAGLVYADQLTTVSPSYAQEITTPAYGCGLDGVLRERLGQGALQGILNGVDYREWNTTKNPHLRFPYSLEDLAGKAAEKAHLQADLGLEVRADVPLFGNISRLVEQKGTDLIVEALRGRGDDSWQFVQLGTGDPGLEKALLEMAWREPKRVAVTIGYDASLAHRIEAASDFYLMPSRFEPCGLNQLYSLRYGAVPIVRSTGGLEDSVVDVREDVRQANGIKFQAPESTALGKGLDKAQALFQESSLLEHFRRNGMQADFSWNGTVRHYFKLYESLITGRRR